MLKSILRLVPDPIHQALRKPSFRYSSHFMALQNLLAYNPRETMLKTALDFVAYSAMEGDYLEFGVFRGDTFSAAFHLAQTAGLGAMRFYAFDSFAGLPAVAGHDAAGFRHFSEGEFACDVGTFEANLREKEVDGARVTTIPGFFDRSLNAETRARLPLDKAAVVWVDCDLYESTVPVLDFITGYLQEGTVLIFDDWFCFRSHPERGEQRAFREWMERNPRLRATPYHSFGWHGHSFLMTP
jgi:hypothetical protein